LPLLVPAIPVRIWGWCVCAGLVLTMLAALVIAQQPPATPAFIRAATTRDRAAYLGSAVIWRDPGSLTPDQIRTGPPADIPDTVRRPTAGAPMECRYERPGSDLGGHTPKFTCRAADGRTFRIKYYDESEGNREVFAEVAATRLVWALGFDADAMFPVAVRCLDCPEKPSDGKGPRGVRQYVASLEPHYKGTIITSTNDIDQGWSFGELEEAIDQLSAPADRARQRTQFDALSLLAVLIQHGDRKPSQQRLVCERDVDLTAGELREITDHVSRGPRSALFEHPGARACHGDAIVTLQDIGATFGGAGQTTNRVTAKVHLQSWAAKSVFVGATDASHRTNAPRECRGNLSTSGAAGSGARERPRISESGRAFLAAQLARLTPEHLRAVFEVARLDALSEPQSWTDRTGRTHTGIDAWVAVLLDKIRQVDEQRCVQ
jgi:hypothetical protein